MLHTHSKIWVHVIWATKNRELTLTKGIGISLYKHLIDRSINELKIPFEQLNVQPEHIHGLIDLPTNVYLSDFMQKVKGESSHWINSNKLIEGHFEWQRGFGAYSVSSSQLVKVKKYIQNQSNHHKIKTFNDE